MFDWLNPYASPSIPADGPYHPQFALGVGMSESDTQGDDATTSAGNDPALCACPVCGGPLVPIRMKLVCERCHVICETCCEGGRG
jgi:hypothetical protein